MSSLLDVLTLSSREGRVCPKPPQWNRMYELLPNRKRDGYGFIPAAPLILAAWWETVDEQKRDRLVEHFEWAEKHGALVKVHTYLSALREEEWHHVGD